MGGIRLRRSVIPLPLKRKQGLLSWRKVFIGHQDIPTQCDCEALASDGNIYQEVYSIVLRGPSMSI